MSTSRGLDVSAYQGVQDWTAHKNEGVVFAFAKASEGEHTHDSRFATHISGIKAAGIVPGGYHFAWPNQPAAVEAANYIAAVKSSAGNGFCHWLDLERYSDGRNYAGRSAAQIKAYVTQWLAAVRKAFPSQQVGVYTSGSDLLAGHVPDGVPLWYPSYPWGAAAFTKAEAAAQPKPSGRAPLIWQFTSQPLDRSICYLSPAALRAWAAGDTTTSEDDMPLTKADLETLAGTDGIFSAPEDAADYSADPKSAAHYWSLNSHLVGTTSKVRGLEKTLSGMNKKLDAMTASIATLASLVGSGVDTSAVVAAVQKAIADAVVKVDVDVTGAPSTPEV